MVNNLKKISAAVLIFAVLFFASLAILSIWDIIDVEQIMRKSIYTLIVIFSAAIVILFVLSNFFKNDGGNNSFPPR